MAPGQTTHSIALWKELFNIIFSGVADFLKSGCGL